jgi:hypothetical protein
MHHLRVNLHKLRNFLFYLHHILLWAWLVSFRQLHKRGTLSFKFIAILFLTIPVLRREVGGVISQILFIVLSAPTATCCQVLEAGLIWHVGVLGL